MQIVTKRKGGKGGRKGRKAKEKKEKKERNTSAPITETFS